MDTNEKRLRVPKRILNTLLTSLSAGVVPRSGAPYIAIGRQAEINAFMESLDAVAEGGAAVRFLIGRYGSGKSFLTQLVRGYALEKGFLTADADLSPERRLSGSNHTGLATYRELIRNLACRTAPEGGALPIVLSRFLDTLRHKLAEQGVMPEDDNYSLRLRQEAYRALSGLEEGVGGFDFATVLGAYLTAVIDEDEEKKLACLRWLRGEYTVKTEARLAMRIPVTSVIDDNNWYDILKLWAQLSVRLGYRGFAVFVDECVNLYKIPNRISREANYEKILSIFNDALQGRAAYLGVFFCGTPQFLEDTRRGLFGYEALRSRLADTRFNQLGYVNYSSPVIRLRVLSENELLALLARLTSLYAEKTAKEEALTPDQMVRFLSAAMARTGSGEMMTPRELIRDYLGILTILDEHPEVDFDALLSAGVGEMSAAPLPPSAEADTPFTGEVGGTKKVFTLADIEI